MLLPRLIFLLSFSLASFADDNVTFQLDWLPGGDKAPVYVGLDQGYFEDEGLKVVVASGRGSTDAVTKLSTGRSDIGTVGLGALMAAKAQFQVPVTAVYSMFTKPPHAFLVAKGQGIERVADLKGKIVATSPFTSSNVYLPLFLEKNGLSMDDIRLVKTDPGVLGPMLVRGKADAIIEWVTNSPRHLPNMEKAGKELLIIPWASSGMEIYATSLVANDRFLKERPDVARRFVRAYERAIKFTQQNQRQAAEIVHSFYREVPVDVAHKSIVHFDLLSNNEIADKEGHGAFNPARLAETWQWVARAQSLDLTAFDPETTVDRGFHPDIESKNR